MIKDKIDNSCPFHQSQAVSGVHYRNTKEMCVKICTTEVASDGKFYPDGVSEELFLYKEYRKAGRGLLTGALLLMSIHRSTGYGLFANLRRG